MKKLLEMMPKNSEISINSLDDIYKFINKHYEVGTPGEVHAKK